MLAVSDTSFMPEVLVVDDDPDIRMLVAFALEDAGYTVRHASDGEKALESIAAKVPDIVVLDVMMPGTDGITVLQRIRARRQLRGLKVVMLTTRIGERDHLRGWEGGADEYITKPFDPQDLATRVRGLLHASQESLEKRREAEVQKAELLERLDAAFNNARTSRSPGMTALLNRQQEARV
jgi:DNA-binding response OmpR family regulator